MQKIIYGDCQEKIKNIKDKSINLIIIDPPYLIESEKWDKKEVINSEISKELFRVLKDNGNLYIWCGIGEKSQSLIRWFPIFNNNFYFKDLITWKKQRGIGMKKRWLYTREEIMWFVKDNKKFIWNKNKQYGKEKRNYIRKNGKSYYKRITNVWIDINEEMYDKINQDRINKKWFKNINKKYPNLHKTIKPLKAIKRIIELHTNENDVILDCFAGSGTTGVACQNLNRNFILIEKEKKYIEIIQKRLNKENNEII